MKTIMPSHMDEDFGIGCAEADLDHLVIDPVFQPYVQQIVDMSRIDTDFAVNWIDANLNDVIRPTMLDKQGNEIDEECTETTYRVEDGRVTIVINDQNGGKAFFELGAAETIWGESLKKEPAASPRVLVVINGGNADYVADLDVDVVVFDWDNFNADPVQTDRVPEHFADLAEPLGIPVE
jgi:hypothetical protein